MNEVQLTISEYKVTPRAKAKLMLEIQMTGKMDKKSESYRIALDVIDLIDKKRREVNAQ